MNLGGTLAILVTILHLEQLKDWGFKASLEGLCGCESWKRDINLPLNNGKARKYKNF